MIRETKPIINSQYFEKLKEKKPKIEDFLDFFDSTRSAMKINKKFIKIERDIEKKEFISNSVTYSLVLRLRGVFIIHLLLKNQDYSHENFRKWLKQKIPDLDFEKAYEGYQSIKDDKEIRESVKISDAESLGKLLENEIVKLEDKIKHARK